MESRNFSKSSIQLETTLVKKIALIRTKVLRPTLLGLRDRGPKQEPALVYLVERDNKKAKIYNNLNQSSVILNASKVIFFERLLLFLKYFKQNSIELTYADTGIVYKFFFYIVMHKRILFFSIHCVDSAIFTINNNGDLKKLVRPEYKHQADEILGDLLEDSASPISQQGFFKIEGVFRFGLFRCPKNYLLRDQLHTLKPKDSVRVRSIKRSYHDFLDEKVFGQDPRINRPSVRTVSMAPSRSFEVCILEESKYLSHAFNLKRRAIDPVHSTVL